MATLLHLGLEPLLALGVFAAVGVVGLVSLLLLLEDLRVAGLDVSLELLGGAEPLVDPGSLAGATDVLLLLGADLGLPLVDSVLVTPEVGGVTEGGATLTGEPDPEVD